MILVVLVSAVQRSTVIASSSDIACEWAVGAFMDCVSGSISCEVQQWLVIASGWVSQLATALVDRFNELVDWIKAQLKELIAIGSFAFAIWKWLRYRDSALFARFRELLEKEERRLRHARSDLTEIIARPAPGQTAVMPLFAEESLRQVFRKRRWSSVLSSDDRQTRTDKRLTRALERIDEQIEWAERQHEFFREQRATVHLLKGAIASARSKRVQDDVLRKRLDNEALTHFRDALAVPGNEKDVQATEYSGRQLLRLEQYQAALLTFNEMEALANALENGRQKVIHQARAKWLQAEACRLRSPPAKARANILMIEAHKRLASIAPLFDRALLDQAQMHEMHGCLRLEMKFPAVAADSLGAAKECYERLLDSLDLKKMRLMRRLWRQFLRFFRDDGSYELRKAARDGLARVDSALKDGKCS
jgi:hypothetical protein